MAGADRQKEADTEVVRRRLSAAGAKATRFRLDSGLVSGSEPPEVANYLMQARRDAVYVGGTGVLDLEQFTRGFGRHLVQHIELPDHSTYLSLDEYLVAANRKELGFSMSSGEIADHLLGLYPARELLMALVQLNRIRRIPDHFDAVRQAYSVQIPPRAARRMQGLVDNRTDGRHFLARQPILLAMREVLLRDSSGVADAPLPVDVAAIMLTHALATDLHSDGAGPSLWDGMPAAVLMEVVCNASFNSTEDLLSRLDRMWRVYIDHGERAATPPPRRPFAELAADALGADIGAIVVIGLLLNQLASDWRWPLPVRVPRTFVGDARAEDMNAFIRYVSSDFDALRARLAEHASPWGFLPLEESPVLRLGDELLVLDQEFLERRLTTGLFWEIGENERRNHGGDKAWRAWSKAHGQAIEATAREQIRTVAPRIPDIGAGRDLPTYFTDADLIAAYPAKRKRDTPKQADSAVWMGDCWLVFEIVMHDLQLPTRQGRDLEKFRDDVEKMVMKKVRQLEVTSGHLGTDAGAALLGYRPPEMVIQPILVQGGHFPVHPVTTAYIDAQLKKEQLLAERDPRIRRLAILHLEELEALEEITQQGQSLRPLFEEWQRSERRAGPLKNFLIARGRLKRPARLTLERLQDLVGQLSSRVVRRDHRD